MFLIEAIKHVEKKLKTCFLRDCLGEVKPVLFLFALGLLAATKTLFKRNEKRYLRLLKKPFLNNYTYYPEKDIIFVRYIKQRTILLRKYLGFSKKP